MTPLKPPACLPAVLSIGFITTLLNSLTPGCSQSKLSWISIFWPPRVRHALKRLLCEWTWP